MRHVEIESMPGSFESMKRVDAWFQGHVLDRAPVRFSRHNAQYDSVQEKTPRRWASLKERWMDAEYQVDAFLRSIQGHTVRGESFPVYWPNLGPDIYAAFFGCELEFGEVTSWSHPIITDLSDDSQLERPVFNPENEYLRQLGKATELALEKCAGKALVGVTSWCPGIDCVAAWRGPENLCMDLLLEPDRIHRLLAKSLTPFKSLVDGFSRAILGRGLPLVGWMGIPFAGTIHIAQTDFANMISPAQFAEFCLPYMREEIVGMDRVIFHMDGKGVANHLEYLLAEPGIQAIQWVQGVGDDQPILQWVPLIKRIQAAGKSVVVDLTPDELEPFLALVRPEGIFLCIAAEERDQDAIVRRLLSWSRRDI